MARTVAKGLKPRLIIAENDGKWSLRTETTFKTMTVEFTPNTEFVETTGDGRELKVMCNLIALMKFTKVIYF